MKYPKIAHELLLMLRSDQRMRFKNLRDENYWNAKIDRKHTQRMKEIVAEIGWPTIPLVGARASAAAELLVRHADHDVVFQGHCLILIKRAGYNNVDLTGVAYLEDRVQVNLGLPQIYGTQFHEVGGKYVLRPIMDRRHVDARRQRMGLDTLKEGEARYHNKYKKYERK